MSETFGFAAEILRRSAAGYAGNAASLLLERDDALRAQAGALDAWKSHLTQRLMELSAALDAGQTRLFTERVVWSRKTFAARDQSDDLIASSLESLRDTLSDSLPSPALTPVQEYLNAALDELEQPHPGQDSSELDPSKPNDRLVLEYLQHILDGNSLIAQQAVIESVAGGLSLVEAYIDVLLAAQKEIGRLWHANEVTVAEEHLVSMTTQKTMAVLAYSATRQPSNGATVVTACIAGNAHDIGPRALADLYQLAGWRSVFLGADVPVSDLPAMLDAYGASVISLTGTLSTQVGQAAETVRAIRERCERPVKILVGGAMFDEAPDVADTIGADAYAPDIRGALRISADFIA
ncbi:MAG: hypothetical protein HKN56_02940 [Gammaproteobacteria bacterium]|nr:hypothetical protein [Gammaproteobacteria bacterium]